MKIRLWVDEFLDGTNLLIEPYNAECKKLYVCTLANNLPLCDKNALNVLD